LERQTWRGAISRTLGEIVRVTPRVPGQQRASQHGGMSPNEEVGQEIAIRPTLAAIAHKCLARKEGRFARDVLDNQSQFVQLFVQGDRYGEGTDISA
jgi:hypothetical protein